MKVTARFNISELVTFSQSLGNTPKCQVDKLIIITPVPLNLCFEAGLDQLAFNRISLGWSFGTQTAKSN